MSFMNDYLREKQKLAKEEAVSYSNSTKAKSKQTKKLSNFMEEYERERSAFEASNDFAPVRSNISRRITVAQNEDNERSWFKTPDVLDDGFDWTDFDDWKGLAKATLASGVDLTENAVTGLVGLGESLVDGMALLGPYLAKGQAYQSMAETGYYNPDFVEQTEKAFEDSHKWAEEFVPKNLINEEVVARKGASKVESILGVSAEKDSVFGEKSDSIAQSAGHLVGQYALSAAGVPWWLTAFTSAAGSEGENALNQGATFGEAAGSGTISGAAEVLSEMMFGGDVFTNGSGLSVSDKILTRTIANKGLRTFLKWGIDLFGEGAEETVSDIFSNLGTSLYREENLSEILASEEALEGYLESWVGGMVLGGGMSAININQAKREGKDYTSGLTEAQEAEVRKRYEDGLKEQGVDLNFFQKNKLVESALESVRNGEASPDAVLNILEGERTNNIQESKEMVDDSAVAPSPKNSELQRLIEERQALQDILIERYNNELYNEETENLAKQWGIVDSQIKAMEAPKATPKPVENRTPTEKAQKSFRDSVFDFEKLFGLDTEENRSKYKAVVKATELAQNFISKGAEGVKPIAEIFRSISDAGNYEDFQSYVYHALNVDRASLDTRFGKENRYVFGEEVTAEDSQRVIDWMDAQHPEFRDALEDVYAFNRFLLDLQVKGGVTSQETADLLNEMYPHYAPISRSRWGNTPSDALFKFINQNSADTVDSDSIDYFLNEVNQNEPLQSITSHGYDFNPLIDAMVDHAMRTYWTVAMKNSGASPDAIIAPDGNVEQTPDKTDDVFEPGTIPEAVEESSAEPTPPRREDLMDNRLGIVKLFQEYVLDNGYFAERLSKKTGNRNLESRWHDRRNARAKAQHIIGNGADGVRALTDIKTEVDKAGLADEFSAYMWHQRNIDGMTMQSRFGLAQNREVIKYTPAAKSMAEVRRLESEHPEFKKWAEDCYAYTGYFIDQYVDRGLLSRDDGEVIKELYPHYVPVRTKKGVIQPLFETMAQFSIEAENAYAMNAFGSELENTLHTTTWRSLANIESFIRNMDAGDSQFTFGTNGKYRTLSIFDNGEIKTFDITKEMFLAMQSGGWMDIKIPVFSHVSEFMRKATTEYNIFFALKNMVRDPQDIIYNSQHPMETYTVLISGEALNEMVHKGKYYQEYIENGGEPMDYFDPKKKKFDSDKKVSNAVKKWSGLELISNINGRIETQPRLAEYIASRKLGKSIEEAMLNSARVTTNFAAGGKLTKFLNRNGCTFLNASVQGALQHARNVTEAKQKGFKGWASMAARYVASGLTASALNQLFWDDDEEYEELPDYITNNYYLLWKTEDGQFLRLPKGRTNVVIENAIKQVAKMSLGDDEADWNEFYKLFLENLAPNNPVTDNIFAPIIEVAKNESWYGEDIVPKRLQDEPVEEQFDEKTDSFSILLGELTGYSPKKINYLLNSYTGVIGDVLLPMGTPKAEGPSDSFVGKVLNPLRDIFTTDSTLNNRVTGDFYDTLEEAESRAGFADATPEEELKSSFLISCNAEISKLLQEQRDIQTSDLPDSEKYQQTRAIKAEINELMEQALEDCEDIEVDGRYAEVGGRRYNYDADKERWYEITPKKKNGEDNFFYTREQNVTKAFGLDYADYWNNKEAYDDAFYIASGYDNEAGGEGSTMATVKYVFGVENFASFAPGLASIKADYDDDGNVISGSKRKKLEAYLEGLDIPEVEKYILFKSQYNWDTSHNYEIIDYLNERDDIRYYEMVDILKELGFDVDSEGNITWEED